jgi:hypothetical protein
MTMVQAEAVLGGAAPRSNGAFLFRKSTAEDGAVVLSMMWEHTVQHFVVKIAEGAGLAGAADAALIKQLRKFVQRFAKKTDGVLPGILTEYVSHDEISPAVFAAPHPAPRSSPAHGKKPPPPHIATKPRVVVSTDGQGDEPLYRPVYEALHPGLQRGDNNEGYTEINDSDEGDEDDEDDGGGVGGGGDGRSHGDGGGTGGGAGIDEVIYSITPINGKGGAVAAEENDYSLPQDCLQNEPEYALPQDVQRHGSSPLMRRNLSIDGKKGKKAPPTLALEVPVAPPSPSSPLATPNALRLSHPPHAPRSPDKPRPLSQTLFAESGSPSRSGSGHGTPPSPGNSPIGTPPLSPEMRRALSIDGKRKKSAPPASPDASPRGSSSSVTHTAGPIQPEDIYAVVVKKSSINIVQGGERFIPANASHRTPSLKFSNADVDEPVYITALNHGRSERDAVSEEADYETIDGEEDLNPGKERGKDHPAEVPAGGTSPATMHRNHSLQTKTKRAPPPSPVSSPQPSPRSSLKKPATPTPPMRGASAEPPVWVESTLPTPPPRSVRRERAGGHAFKGAKSPHGMKDVSGMLVGGEEETES